MAKEEKLVLRGRVVEALPRGFFKVLIPFEGGNESFVNATLAGKLRTSNIRVLMGDEVDVEVSPYDLTKGRITYRHTGGRPKPGTETTETKSESEEPKNENSP